jgi:hypothetical protein
VSAKKSALQQNTLWIFVVDFANVTLRWGNFAKGFFYSEKNM